MSPQRTVEAFVIPAIKNERILAEGAGLPCDLAILDRLLSNCPVVLVDPVQAVHSLPFNDIPPAGMKATADVTLHRVSSAHKRSFEVTAPGLPPIWQDEFGHTYTGLSLKGVNFSKPGVMEHPTAPDGFIAYGLQESQVIGRALRASKILRERGVSTEYLLGIAELKQYPWPTIEPNTDAHELIPLQEYKNRIVMLHWRSLSAEERTADALLELHDKFKDMTFYASLRATDTPFRMLDLSARAAREPLFSYVNSSLLDVDMPPFNSNSPLDTIRFLRDFWGPRAATNLYKIHPDLAHEFPHGHNMTALGGFVDLDSVHGSGLHMGDEPIAHANRANDLVQIVSAIDLLSPYSGIDFRSESGPYMGFLRTYFKLIHDQDGITSLAHETTLAYEGELLLAFEEKLLLAKNITEHVRTEVLTELWGTYSAHFVNDSANEKVRNSALICGLNMINNKEFASKLDAAFEKLLPDYAEAMIFEYINQINTADAEGRIFDVAQTFFDLYNSGSLPILREIQQDLTESFVTLLTAELISRNTSLDVGIDQVTNASVKAKIVERIIKRQQQALEAIIQGSLSTLVTRCRDAITEQMTYSVPDMLFDDADSFLHPGFHNKWLWRASDNISYETMMECIAKNNYDVQIEDLTIYDDGAVPFKASSEEAVIREIITDTVYENILYVVDGGLPCLEFNFSLLPAYALIVEDYSDGSTRLRLQRPRASNLNGQHSGSITPQATARRTPAATAMPTQQLALY